MADTPAQLTTRVDELESLVDAQDKRIDALETVVYRLIDSVGTPDGYVPVAPVPPEDGKDN